MYVGITLSSCSGRWGFSGRSRKLQTWLTLLVRLLTAKWARLCPGNHESAGQRLYGKTGQSNAWLRSALVQAANTAIRCKYSYLNAVYRRLAARRGHKKAIIAVAHQIVIALYYMLTKHEAFRDLGANYLNEYQQERLLQRLCRRATHLGYQQEAD